MTDKCNVCKHNPAARNNDIFECAHAECPYRRSAWSERPTAEELYKGPWAKNVDEDPKPLTGDARENSLS